jgi:hypothetical protein
VLARNGDLEAALSLAREAVECAATTDDVNAHAAALADQAEVLRLASQEDEARCALDAAVELYRLKGNVVGEEGLRRRW